jgi:hypothetical protein
MDIAKQIQEVAVNTFRAILPASAGDDGTFRVLLTAKVGDEVKPLLLIGNAHSRVEDGHVLAVLNPDKAVCERLAAGCAYSKPILKKIVEKRCDLALDICVDAYTKVNPVKVFTKYQAESPNPAKFTVR